MATQTYCKTMQTRQEAGQQVHILPAGKGDVEDTQALQLCQRSQGRLTSARFSIVSRVKPAFVQRIPIPALFMTALLGLSVLSSGASAAPSLDAYVLTAGGSSLVGASGPLSCTTFGPDSRAAIFGGGFQVGLPTDGAICGVASDSRAVRGSSGTVQTAATLGVAFGPSVDSRTFTGSAQARAGYGDLGVRAVAVYTGSSDGLTVSGSQAGARQVEALTIGGGSGNGTYRPTFTIDGSLFNAGRTESEIEFGYSIGSGPTFLGFRIINSNSSGISLYANGNYQAALPGMSITGDAVNGYTVAGTTTFAINVPIVFGATEEISFSLWAATLPRFNLNLLTPRSGDASFLSGVRLTGIQVLNNSGTALDEFTITSGSGTLYGPGGVIAKPEPSAVLMFCAGLLFLRFASGRAGPRAAMRQTATA